MPSFNQNKGFFVALGFIFAAFAGLLVWALLVYFESAAAEGELALQRQKVAALLGGHPFPAGKAAARSDPVSLTIDSVEAAKKDLEELQEHQASLKASIAGDPQFALAGRPTANSSELTSLIRQSVDEWKRLAQEKEVRLLPNDQCDFGFRRYIRNPGTSPRKDLVRVDQQRNIIGNLFALLVESRPQGAPLLLISIDREPVETFVIIPEGKPGAGTVGPDPDAQRANESDEFAPLRTFKRPGQVETLSFRVRFVGTTPTLRTFVNKVRNSGRPFAITNVDVALPSAESLRILATTASAPGASANGPAPAAPAASAIPGLLPPSVTAPGDSSQTPKDERISVVTARPSEFTVQLDYLSIPESAPPESGEPKK